MSQTEVQLIKADAVQTADIANSAVTDAKISALTSSKLTGALPAISGASLTNLPAGGISIVDNWYVNAALQPGSGSTPITANWERGTSAPFGSIGSAMTQSSGLFAFPSTGIYYCSINGNFYRGTGHRRYLGFTIQTTADNGSNYTDVASQYDSLSGDTNSSTHSHVVTTFVFDCTNISTHKVRFQIEASDSGTTIGDISGRRLNVLFMRLGDT